VVAAGKMLASSCKPASVHTNTRKNEENKESHLDEIEVEKANEIESQVDKEVAVNQDYDETKEKSQQQGATIPFNEDEEDNNTDIVIDTKPSTTDIGYLATQFYDTDEDNEGKPKYRTDRLYDIPPPGVVTGLAWNSLGGSLIWIESVVIHHKKPGLKTTGKLGKVMKESIEIASTFAKKFLSEIDPNNAFFDTGNVHIHFPEGATPKDGPSAGISICSALLSLALNKAIDSDISMTGELSLNGEIYKIGGVQAKVTASKALDIRRIILPWGNRTEYFELPQMLKEGLEAYFVKEYKEVYAILFGDSPKDLEGIEKCTNGKVISAVQRPQGFTINNA